MEILGCGFDFILINLITRELSAGIALSPRIFFWKSEIR
jgi:hypothetical protein